MRPYLVGAGGWAVGFALACGGGGTEPRPLPDALACIGDVHSRPSGSIEDVHDAAGHAHGLRTKEKKLRTEMCDPETDRMRSGFLVYTFAMQVARDDVAESAELLEWAALELGNPSAAVKLGTLLIKGGPDGRPAQDVVRGAGFDAGADAVTARVLQAEGRGRLIDLTAVPHGRNVELLRAHGQTLQMQRPNVDLLAAEVKLAFERTLD